MIPVAFSPPVLKDATRGERDLHSSFVQKKHFFRCLEFGWLSICMSIIMGSSTDCGWNILSYSAIPTTSSFRTLTWQTQPSATHVASCVHHGWHSFKRKHGQSSKILPLVDYSGLYYLWYIDRLSKPMWSELPWTNRFNPFHSAQIIARTAEATRQVAGISEVSP